MAEKISGIVITYNEQENIEQCLKSLSRVAEEIIVVDSFSTDNTENICSKFENVRFFKREFDGYSSQKNFAFGKASHPKVLSLDADEVLSDELINSIILVKANWGHDGYYCNRLNNYCGKWIHHGGWYPDSKLRLWDIRKGAWDDSIVHEKVILSPGSTVGYLKGDILHYSYKTISAHIAQLNQFTELSALQMHNQNKIATITDIILRPVWKFIHAYFLKRGFCDGYYGFVVSAILSFTTFLKYVKLRELNKKSC